MAGGFFSSLFLLRIDVLSLHKEEG
jgi:hypothetical protein